MPIQGDPQGGVAAVLLQDAPSAAKRGVLRAGLRGADLLGAGAERWWGGGSQGTYSLNLLVRSRNWLLVSRRTSNLQRFWNS